MKLSSNNDKRIQPVDEVTTYFYNRSLGNWNTFTKGIKSSCKNTD